MEQKSQTPRGAQSSSLDQSSHAIRVFRADPVQGHLSLSSQSAPRLENNIYTSPDDGDRISDQGAEEQERE